MKNFLITLLFVFATILASAQGTSCANATDLGTPTSTPTCTVYSTAGSGSAPCSGSGYGGSGGYRYFRFCTNSAGDCVNFSMSDGTTSGNWAIRIYNVGCTSGVGGGCLGNTGAGATYTTSGAGLAANTCYIARVWVKNPGNFTLCTSSMAPSNDNCTGSTQISSTPQSSNNFCTTAGPTTNTPTITPANLCAGSLENTAWYTFTVLNTANVVVTINNISCSGGGSGFQIGYFTGSCGSLNNIGCNSGSGGSVTTTITGLSAGNVVTVAIDGNAGANCTFDISATNTVPLPVELLEFDAEYDLSSNTVDLTWLTDSEINNDFFTVEKSTDGEVFEVVEIIDGAGNSNKRLDYSTKDNKPYSGNSYYRLKQTDFDGQFDYSKIVAVKVPSNFEDLGVFPNPVTGKGYLTFKSNASEKAELTVYDVTGRTVLNENHTINEGSNKIDLNVSDFKQGMYFIYIHSATEQKNIKFIKK